MLGPRYRSGVPSRDTTCHPSARSRTRHWMAQLYADGQSIYDCLTQGPLKLVDRGFLSINQLPTLCTRNHRLRIDLNHT